MTLEVILLIISVITRPLINSRDFYHSFQEVYISKVKTLLGKELHLENGSHVDGVEQNGKSNGFTNGSHKEEADDVAMGSQEEEEEEELEAAVKSPTASKGKGGRRSKGNSDTKSKPMSLSHNNFFSR